MSPILSTLSCSELDTIRRISCNNKFVNESFSISYYAGTTMKNYYDGRFGGQRFWNLKTNRRPEDEQGLVGSGEQSIFT
jgi:hypothetical protein